ncbi:MAG: hypothetical protein LBJ31_03555 [Treponema sp.]|jgi:diacylglycerol kinase family enzyme|nr:hypothetical protein [Treponema sp.]
MKHLFIINPTAAQLRGVMLQRIQDEITEFFGANQLFNFDVHITRWKRDAVGFVRRYVNNSSELVRIYAVGGNGTLFEVINGCARLPNVQVAFLPMGRINSPIYSFGGSGDPFKSLWSLTTSKIVSLDLIHAGNNFCFIGCFIGLGADADEQNKMLSKFFFLPRKIIREVIFFWAALRSRPSYYTIKIDGEDLSGEYLSIQICNTPAAASSEFPALWTSMTDGRLELYLIKKPPLRLLSQIVSRFEQGHYYARDDYIIQKQGRSVSIQSDRYISAALDEEHFYGPSFDFTLVPKAVDFVLPYGIQALQKNVPQEPA